MYSIAQVNNGRVVTGKSSIAAVWGDYPQCVGIRYKWKMLVFRKRDRKDFLLSTWPPATYYTRFLTAFPPQEHLLTSRMSSPHLRRTTIAHVPPLRKTRGNRHMIVNLIWYTFQKTRTGTMRAQKWRMLKNRNSRSSQLSSKTRPLLKLTGSNFYLSGYK